MNKTQFSFFFFFHSNSSVSHDINHDVVPADHRDTRPSFRDLQLRFHTPPLCDSLKRVLLCSSDFTGFRHPLPKWRSEGRPSGSWNICSTCTLMISLVLFFSSCFLRRTPALEKWGEKSTSSTTSYIVLTPTMHLSIAEHYNLSGGAMIKFLFMAGTLTFTLRCFIYFPKIISIYLFIFFANGDSFKCRLTSVPLASELQKVCCLLHLELWTTPHPCGSFSTVGLDLLERSDSLWTLQRQQQQGKRTTFWHRLFFLYPHRLRWKTHTHTHTSAHSHNPLKTLHWLVAGYMMYVHDDGGDLCKFCSSAPPP